MECRGSHRADNRRGGHWQAGPVPYTVLVAPGGKILYRKHDTIDPLELKKTIADHLGRTYASR